MNGGQIHRRDSRGATHLIQIRRGPRSVPDWASGHECSYGTHPPSAFHCPMCEMKSVKVIDTAPCLRLPFSVRRLPSEARRSERVQLPTLLASFQNKLECRAESVNGRTRLSLFAHLAHLFLFLGSRVICRGADARTRCAGHRLRNTWVSFGRLPVCLSSCQPVPHRQSPQVKLCERGCPSAMSVQETWLLVHCIAILGCVRLSFAPSRFDPRWARESVIDTPCVCA